MYAGKEWLCNCVENGGARCLTTGGNLQISKWRWWEWKATVVLDLINTWHYLTFPPNFRYMMVLLVILISISLITKEVEHFFKCFSAIWIFSSEVCLLMFLLIFLLCYLSFSYLFLGVFLCVYGYPFFVICVTLSSFFSWFSWVFQVDSLGFCIRIICKWYCTFFLIVFERIALISRRYFANLYSSDNWTVALCFSRLTPK